MTFADTLRNEHRICLRRVQWFLSIGDKRTAALYLHDAQVNRRMLAEELKRGRA